MSQEALTALKKSRSSFMGVVTRLWKRYSRVAEGGSSTYDIGAMNGSLTSLERTVASCHNVQEKIIDFDTTFLDQPVNLDEELDFFDTFEVNVEATRSLIQRLTATKRAQLASTDLQADLEDLEEATSAHTLRDYSTAISDLTSSLQSLRLILNESTIDEEHPLRRDISRFKSRLHQLSSREKEPSPSILTASMTTPVKSIPVQLPKLHLPTFDGNLMNWAQFWAQFRAAVDSNLDLNQEHKLAYLRDAIKDPSIKALLFSGAERDGLYDEVVKVLHQRFDKKRTIHANYCRTLTNLSAVKANKADLHTFVDTVNHALAGLRHTEQYDLPSFLTSMLVQSIPKSLQVDWELHSKEHRDVPPVEEFLEFVTFRADVLSTPTAATAPEHQSRPTDSKPDHQPRRYKAATHSTTHRSTNGPNASFRYECQLCPGNKHPLFQCAIFNNMSVHQRGEHIRSKKLCYNCLAPGHQTGDCRSLARCKSCGGKHHTLVHREDSSKAVVNVVAAGNTPVPNDVNQQVVSVIASTTNSVSNDVPQALSNCLMMTSQVLVKGPDGRQMMARALLDSGASMSLLSNRVAQTLQLPRRATNVTFSGAQATPLQGSQSITQVSLCPMTNGQPILSVTAAIVPKVTCNLPLQGATHVRDMPHIKPLNLADPTFHSPGRVDLLLGCDILPEIMLQDRTSGPKTAPMALNTVFGWAILGPYLPQCTQQTVNVISPAGANSSDDLLTRFWETEEPPNECPTFSPEEEAVQNHFALTHSYVDPPGHYQVSLPRTSNHSTLGLSRPQALHRFLANERSIQKKGTYEAFQSVVREYLELGHAEMVPSIDLTPSKEHYYLPMHGVSKASSTTTKLRVVFDASARTSNHLSLNDTLATGPTLHPTLENILLRFRIHKIALSADISKMYRAVHLDPGDRDLHRFLWREQPTGPLVDFRMTRVTFGVSSSPYLAIRALQQVAHDFGHQYPVARPLIFDSFYVDDLLTGADTPEQARHTYQQTRALLLKGNFDLRKWRSSSSTALEFIDPSLREKLPVQDLTGSQQGRQQGSHPKALGVEWDSTQDTMSTSLCLPTCYSSTKRGIISDVARTFDVLGWLAPTIVTMKVLYQQLWERKLEWDEELPQPYVQQHLKWREELHLLSSKKQPRCYFAKSATRQSTQLHGFCDASIQAYAAVIYIRATYTDQAPTCVLVTAKTRVAPVKQLSIPRLELCGATLLARLLTSVRKALSIPLSDVYAWCDSTIVLSWLDGSPKRFKTFVGNRLSNILNELPPSTWHHVPTLENPADCASRGLSPSELVEHSLWWEGPPWLRMDPFAMPVQPLLGSDSTPELKAVCSSVTPVPPTWIEERFNSYHTLIHVSAWCHRFITNTKASIRNQLRIITPYLSTAEVEASEHHLFRVAQSQTFSCELLHLAHDKAVKPSSPIKSLTPFIDKHGLIRVGGRLSSSHLTHSQIHPIILSGKSRICYLMFRSKHVSLGHCGPSLILSSTGSKVHVISARRLSRSIYRSCVVCRRATAHSQHQMMGQLPASRITPSPPFTICGVDYAGPFLMKKGHTRRPVIVKGYLAVFVCFATKAAHLEVVSDASTETFLACLRRFISRRGCPAEIHSDNGGNFVGAKRDLQELYDFLEKPTTTSVISSYLLTKRVQWHSTPERAPHFGGLWEAAVKSAKRHLKRVIGTQKMTYEEFSTVAAQVEACLNSRPLVAITSHSTDGVSTLTPGHFLINRELCAYPEIPIQTEPSLHRRWNMCQAVVAHFWKRWSAEYLQQLQGLQKWRTPTPNLKVGDVVVIRDDNVFTNHWPMARVLETHPGKDGLVRVVSLKTQTTVLKRPVTKLALLLSEPDAPSDLSLSVAPTS